MLVHVGDLECRLGEGGSEGMLDWDLDFGWEIRGVLDWCWGCLVWIEEQVVEGPMGCHSLVELGCL